MSSTLAFIGNGEPPNKLMEIWKKMTPGSTGRWGDLVGIPTYDADYFAVIDEMPSTLKARIPESKCVFLGAHPEIMHGYRNVKGKGLAAYDCTETVGFLEWWIRNTYDELKAMAPPPKTKGVCCILSDANSQDYHRKRRAWAERFTASKPSDFNLYGRIKPWGPLVPYYRGACGSIDPRGAAASGGNDHMSGKEQTYLAHRYAVEFDAGPCAYYFSERVLDAMLLWCVPLYWGGRNLHTFLPPESFRYLDVNGRGEEVREAVASGFYEEHIHDLAKAREILLDELQLWPRIHKAIFGRCK